MEAASAHASKGIISGRDMIMRSKHEEEDLKSKGNEEMYANPVTPARPCEDEDKAALPGRRATPSSLSSSSFASVEQYSQDVVPKDLNSVFASMGVHGDGEGLVESEEDSTGKKLWRPDDSKEPILMENDERFCLLPVKYHKAYEYYKMAQASYWTVEEVDLSQDKRDWDRLTAHEKHFISYVLAFFAASDGIVLENLAVRFMQGMFIIVSCYWTVEDWTEAG